jgi:23S rRNA U2552 (ribose-2'-O)-methylase RlmE/FtsJ
MYIRQIKSPPPWKNIEFYKNTLFLNAEKEKQSLPIKGTWQDNTPDVILNLKNQIGEKEEEPTWDLAKRITNPYELIFTSSNRVDLPQSISILKPLSRSFFKLVEMLEISKFFETTKVAKYKSLHLCEGPGGFIEAFLDRADRYRKNISMAYAMTLKQTNHNIPGWRAASRLLSRHPEIQIEYGADGTGNILEKENQKFLENLLKHSAHLVTADGGFDFSIDFQAQEKLVFPLLVASAKIACTCLAKDGMFILKIFDSFSEVTQNFLAFLALHFREYTIYKPATSRPCNSERYFIGRGFKGFTEQSRQIFDLLLEYGTDVSWSVIDHRIEQIRKNMNIVTSKYVEEQESALTCVLSFPTNPQRDIIDASWKEQERLCIQWCSYFHIPSRQFSYHSGQPL